MKIHASKVFSIALVIVASVAGNACSSNSAGLTGGTATGGTATGGTAGITQNSGGVANTAGVPGTGGTTATGGSVSFTGGAPSLGGRTTSAGGATIMGGTITGAGGATVTGGTTNRGVGGTTSGAGGTTPAKGGTNAMGGTTSGGGGTSAAGGTTYNTSAVTTTCPGAVPTGVTSTFCSCVNEGPGYNTSGFTVANNVWGSGAGPECVWATTSTLWGFASNHPQTGGVKSYPNIGLSPRKLLSSINSYTSSFDITVPGNVGVWEAAYDIWLRTPGGGNTRIEIMIWMYTYKAGPISSVVATTKPTIGNYTWTVHYGSNGTNATISFVNTSPSTGTTANVTSGTVDIKAMLDWLIANNNTQFGKFDNTWTLDQVQWGWEISSDGGATQEFINNSFSVSSN
jgi:hypothetical protein